jgi:hypothetical protein
LLIVGLCPGYTRKAEETKLKINNGEHKTTPLLSTPMQPEIMTEVENHYVEIS